MGTEEKIRKMIQQYRVVDNWFALDIRNLVWRMHVDTLDEIGRSYDAYPVGTKVALNKKSGAYTTTSTFLGIDIEFHDSDEILLAFKVVEKSK
jgi:hypothetical protein